MIDAFNLRYESLTKEVLEAFATALAKTLKGGEVLCLTGDLGAGKTTFAQSLIKALGVVEHITSPTYTLMNVYTSGSLAICHMDAYRINEIEELFELGFYDLLYTETLLVIEWADLIQEAIPAHSLWIDFHYAQAGRDLIIKGTERVIEQLKGVFDSVYISA